MCGWVKCKRVKIEKHREVLVNTLNVVSVMATDKRQMRWMSVGYDRKKTVTACVLASPFMQTSICGLTSWHCQRCVQDRPGVCVCWHPANRQLMAQISFNRTGNCQGLWNTLNSTNTHIWPHCTPSHTHMNLPLKDKYPSLAYFTSLTLHLMDSRCNFLNECWIIYFSSLFLHFSGDFTFFVWF